MGCLGMSSPIIAKWQYPPQWPSFGNEIESPAKSIFGLFSSLYGYKSLEHFVSILLTILFLISSHGLYIEHKNHNTPLYFALTQHSGLIPVSANFCGKSRPAVVNVHGYSLLLTILS